nr:transglycosylase SLT domain-containing protein [Leucobacter luti]
MAAAGIAEADWGYVDFIASKESTWNPNATNASSGACGLIQALPCSKVPGNGYDPVDNLTWANGYAVGRYGSWAQAYAFWTANHWW